MLTAIQRRVHRTEDGIAMLSVLLFILVVSILGATLLSTSLQSIPTASHEQHYAAALSDAEAGVDDYLDRLDQDYNYATDPPDGNLALTSNPSKCVAVSTTTPGCFEYQVDTSKLTSTGTVYLYATGIVDKVSRTVKVGLRPFGFLDALSTSSYNLVDPVLDPVINNDPVATTNECVYDAWQANTYSGGTGPAGACGGLLNYWITGNSFNGPMQSNDDYYLCGTPQFNNTISSGDPSATGPYWKDPAAGDCGTDAPYFADGSIQGQHTVTFPPAATTLKSDVVIGQTGAGCLYTGPTSIVLNGTTMTVVSPDTISTNANCVGTNVPLPVNGTIYVQNIPSSTTDPNFGVCNVSQAWTGDACTSGDAFVSGTLSGQLTIATDNNIILTGNVTYSSFTATAPRPVLGLIATNEIEVNHTVLPTSNTACNGHPNYGGYCNQYGNLSFGAGGVQFAVPVVNPTIDAAMLSLQHSFAVMDFTQGPISGLGSVYVDGAIAGKFMDIEGVFGGSGQVTGYGVSYTYDNRFADGGLVPPNFLDPTKSFWHRISFADCPTESSANCP